MEDDSKKTNPTHGERAAALWMARLLARYDDPVQGNHGVIFSADQSSAYAKAILRDPAQLARAVELHGLYLKKDAKQNAETPESEREFYDKLEAELRKDDAMMREIREELRREREEGGDKKRPFRPGGRA